MPLIIKTISSLEKVFPDREPRFPISSASMLTDDEYNYQIALYSDDGWKRLGVVPKLISPIADAITMSRVGLVPSETPVYDNHDDFIESDRPGLYPDLLEPITPAGVTGKNKSWHSLWVSVSSKGLEAGEYPIKIEFTDTDGVYEGYSEFTLKIRPVKLKKSPLIYTCWFHSDCICSYYNIKPYTKDYWDAVGEFMKAASAHGQNMILTPVFTPPLDTQVGGERPTVQLVDVTKTGDEWTFDFTKLKKWIDVAKKNGIKYFEISHLFTQWGAAHAPKIMITEKGVYKKAFGWETDAFGDEYRTFIDAFLPALIGFTEKNKLGKKVFFHVSDEPSVSHMENYRKASEMIKKHLGNKYPVIDALSDFGFYESGLVENPIPAINHIEPFYKSGIKELWGYYCCSQNLKVSNRFFAFPAQRTRIIGVQMYKYNLKGFLQWGYNFWYSRQSLSLINPYSVTDAGGAFPSGDAYVVYPGADRKPLLSLRIKLFADALNDLSALRQLEKAKGKRAVKDITDKNFPEPITFENYPHDVEWLLNLREQLNAALENSDKTIKEK